MTPERLTPERRHTTLLGIQGRRKGDPYVTIEEFDDHKIVNSNNLNTVHIKLGEVQEAVNEKIITLQEREDEKHSQLTAQYDELKRMITPVYQAFTSTKEMDQAKVAFIVRWSGYIGFCLKLAALIALVWGIFKFGVLSVIHPNK